MLKRFLFGLSLAAGLLLLSPTPEAEARGWGWHKSRHAKKHHVRPHQRRARGGFGVPELDPSAAGGALVLLIGGVAYMASRRREDEVA